MFTSAIPAPPAPPMSGDMATILRQSHSRLRRRIMYSMHEPDVTQRVLEAVGPTRAKAWKLVDMTSNPAWYVCSQLSKLYGEIPEVTPPDGGEDVAAAISESGWWQLAQRNQRDAIAMNDMFIRVDVDEDTNEPTFRLVFPDLAEPTASPLRPSQPLAMKEWIPDPENAGGWVQIVTDPRSRTCQVLDEKGNDVTGRVFNEKSLSGANYPYLIGETPVLPYVAYHSAETGTLLDPYAGREVFEGALQLGVYYSFFGHILRNTAHSQRWLLNAEPAGGDVDETGRRREHITDPAVVVILKQLEETLGTAAAAQVGQWTPPVDPERFLAAVERYEQRLVDMALSTVGVSRRQSDVRSAMSLAVSREAQREAQRAYGPVFKRSDLQLLRLVAGLSGAPIDGWRIEHRSLPRDPAELDAELKRITDEIAAGLLDKPTAYMQLHPGLTYPEAEAAVKRIEETNRRLGGAPPIVAPVPAQVAA